MFKTIKSVTVIFVVISVIFISSSAALFIMFYKERVEKITLQSELAQIMKERKKLSLEVEELKLIKGDLEIKVSKLEEQAKTLTEDYEKEKSRNDVVRLKLSKKEEDLKGVNGRLESIMSEKAKLQAILDEEKTKYSQLKERVDKLVEVKDVLEEKVRDIINKQGIELERIVVKAEGELEGRVLVVNRDYGFIVVNVGSRDDIAIGDTLTVFRGGKFVGEAQVEKIYDTMSAATIVKEDKPGAILVDDNVVMKGD